MPLEGDFNLEESIVFGQADREKKRSSQCRDRVSRGHGEAGAQFLQPG